jgi:hypothetical protein
MRRSSSSRVTCGSRSRNSRLNLKQPVTREVRRSGGSARAAPSRQRAIHHLLVSSAESARARLEAFASTHKEKAEQA